MNGTESVAVPITPSTVLVSVYVIEKLPLPPHPRDGHPDTPEQPILEKVKAPLQVHPLPGLVNRCVPLI